MVRFLQQLDNVLLNKIYNIESWTYKILGCKFVF